MADARNVTLAQQLLADIAPGLADLTDGVLFGQVLGGPGLSKRDRSLITYAALVVTRKTEQMAGHFPPGVCHRRDARGTN